MSFVFGIFMLPGCRKNDAVVDAGEAWKKAEAAADAAGTPEARTTILKDFLTSIPESDHTAEALESLVYSLVVENNKPAEAEAFVASLIPRVKLPSLLPFVKVMHAYTLGETGDCDRLLPLLDSMAEEGTLTYDNHMTLVEAARACSLWDHHLRFSEAALDRSTEEAIRAEYPGRDFPAERMARYVQYRRGQSLAVKGWALANLDRVNEALALFEEAGRETVFSYVNVPETPLNVYWGRTLLDSGDTEGAIGKLTPDAVFAGNEEAVAALKEAFRKRYGKEEGFEDFLKETHLDLAPKMKPFTLADYRDEDHSYRDLADGKVVLLTFWFPT